VRRNFDELFDLPFPFAAVPDVFNNLGFKHHFNTGVLMLHRNTSTFESLRARIGDARFPTKEADHVFLNVYFGADVVYLEYLSYRALHRPKAILCNEVNGLFLQRQCEDDAS
jgi:inositol phosphorylceramide glucuronosyltransferase 1